MGKKPIISVVVPVYKEEDNIRPFLARLEPVLDEIGDYEIIFCLDPSPDKTEAVIKEEAERNKRIALITFSRRFGQPAATIAGIRNCSGDACVVIDVDLQDQPELIRELYAKYEQSYDVVYAQRRTRKGETLTKRIVSYVGYKVLNRIADVHIPPNTGDFRIISRRVITELEKLNESHGFLRGLVGLVGFKQASVLYDRDERTHGTGNYNKFFGSLKIGFNGLIGFSNFLLSIATMLGLSIAFISFLIIIYMIVTKLFLGYPYPLGIPAVIVLILFIGSIQLISLGVLGEYIGRIYDEVKKRPMYIIDKSINLRKRDVVSK